MLNIVTCITSNYIDKARPFLASAPAGTNCVCMGFIVSDDLCRDFPNIRFHSIARHQSESHGMSQHGRWLDALPIVDESSVYVLSDGDVVIQRDFTDGERARFAAYDDSTVGIGTNYGDGDTLLDEAARIELRDLKAYGGDGLIGVPVWNCGVMAMRPAAWRQLRDLYESECAAFYQRTANRARCQWLICWCLWKLGFKVDVLGPELHSHNHFGWAPGIEFADGVATYKGTQVMFRHETKR